jgi:hypothetical protein
MVREVFLPPLAAKDFFGASFCFFERLWRSPSRSKTKNSLLMSHFGGEAAGKLHEVLRLVQCKVI